MRVYASRVIAAPIERIWRAIRAFDRLCDWHDAVVDGSIDDGRTHDAVGAVRSFHLADGSLVRERLIALDDAAHTLTYGFVTPAFPIDNYVATMRALPVTATGATFVEWWATFDEPDGRAGRHSDIIANGIFAAGLASLDSFVSEVGA
ncbi:MAG TPA: SRPBCC family protein [Sphingomonas sp.]|nr:SRPBCC family protein [Sphingomonas sp.]